MYLPDHSADRSLQFAAAVHHLAGLIPAGRVLSYGDIAELLGCGGARQVGQAMHGCPTGLAWWRVVRADGTLTEALSQAAQEAWQLEQTPRRGRKVHMGQARWQPSDQDWLAIQDLSRRLCPTKMSAPNDEMDS